MGKEEKKKKAFHVDSTPLLRLSSGVNPPPIIQFNNCIFSYFRKVRTREKKKTVVERMKRWARRGKREEKGKRRGGGSSAG
jgi:hypothetical protein